MNTELGNNSPSLSGPIFGTPGQGRLLAAASLLSLMSSPGLTASPVEGGATAFATIAISVSVARRFGVAAAAVTSDEPSTRAAPTSLCMATNGAATPLPVMLHWPSSPAKEAVPLPPCSAAARSVPASELFDENAQAILVRPE